MIHGLFYTTVIGISILITVYEATLRQAQSDFFRRPPSEEYKKCGNEDLAMIRYTKYSIS